MIRSSTSRLREKASKQYICWQCQYKAQQWISNSAVRLASNATRQRSQEASIRLGQRHFNAGRTTRATVESRPTSDFSQEQPIQSTLREQLRKWEAENAGPVDPSAMHVFSLADRPDRGKIDNSTVRSQMGEFYVEGEEEEVDQDIQNDVNGGFQDDLVDVGLRRSFLVPGDMVEVTAAGGARRELAIFIQDFKSQSQFYTMSGRWLHKNANRVKFSIPNFVKPEEVEIIKPWLPTSDITEEMVGKLQSFDIAQVPRNIGKQLLQKMAGFWQDADSAYQLAAVKMDNAHKLVAHPSKFSYATLSEVARRVLGDIIPTMDDGKFPPHVLYALHRAMMQDDVGFRPQRKQIMRGEGEYEINSLMETGTIKRIANHVREHRHARVARRRGLKSDISSPKFDMFIKKARNVIDASRKLRDFTKYGTLGPSKSQLPEGSNIRAGEVTAHFSDTDQDFIYFLESWSCLRSFSMNSYLSGLGSTILRAIGRYNDVPLDVTTAWTCLAELGVIPPWENQAAFELRLPSISSRVGTTSPPEVGIEKDSMADLRKDWGDLPVYCIDDPSALEIDDGISVETTDNPDEFWIHVHIADPGAYLQPNSPLAQHAELFITSIYLPDRAVSMLPPQWSQSSLSLGPQRPCMTISAKMNLAGEMLDINIASGIINNVIFLTSGVLHEAIFGAPPPAMTHLKVGKGTFVSDAPTRPMLQAQDVSEKQKRDFELFHKLYKAKEHLRTQKGALKYFPSGAEASVSFGGAPWVKSTSGGARYHGDPDIRVSTPPLNDQGIDLSQLGGKLVLATMMLIAGEAGAKWCHARGIPVINRISPFNPTKENPLKFYQEHVLPSFDDNGFPKLEMAMAYLSLVGKTQPSTTPGPHLGIGVEMTMQVTSPLRRFGDCLNQWQIEGALREEARTKKSLIGNTKDDFLPYSRAQIDALLPRLAEREALIKDGQKKANREWILRYLVRAWKYGEDKLASPLLFYARSVDPVTRTVGGVLPSMHTGGNMAIPGHMKADEIAVGDAFEVEIEHIDIYMRVLALNLIRPVSLPELDELDPAFARSLKALTQRS